MKGELNRTIFIYVDSYENGVPVGQFRIASEPDAEAFSSLSRLLIQINDSLDRENYPQSFSELRKFRFHPQTHELTGGAGQRKKGEAATFVVRILFRQNASWQGSVTWLEGNQEEYFRSVLELIYLMDTALAYTKV